MARSTGLGPLPYSACLSHYLGGYDGASTGVSLVATLAGVQLPLDQHRKQQYALSGE